MPKKKSPAQLQREIDEALASKQDRGVLGGLARTLPMEDRPLAARGLTSYRLRGRYGYIMIGARDHEDAMREAARSTPNPDRKALEIWNGDRYVKAFGAGSGSHAVRADTGASTAFEEAKAESALIEKEVDAASEALQAFPRSPLGGTSDAARATPEFRAANARFQKAFARQRAFNAAFVKRFAKELRAERAERTRARESGHGSSR